jgi:hypothetical protein
LFYRVVIGIEPHCVGAVQFAATITFPFWSSSMTWRSTESMSLFTERGFVVSLRAA